MESVALEVKGLHKEYGRRTDRIDVLNGVDLTVPVGSWTTLCGKSGCGKTTLLRILGTLDVPDRGEVTYFGRSLTSMSRLERAELRRCRLGFIFQSYLLFPELTVQENVMLPAQLRGKETEHILERTDYLLGRLHLENRKNHKPPELSGGEQQRVAIARALANQPDIIFADEPTGNLDAKSSGEIMEILCGLREDDYKTIIMVTHDHRLRRYADQVYDLSGGTLALADASA